MMPVVNESKSMEDIRKDSERGKLKYWGGGKTPVPVPFVHHNSHII
jgi:hypothetical protein